MTKPLNQRQSGDDTAHYQMHIRGVRRAPRTPEGYEPVVQVTTRGPIEMRYCPADPTARAAIFVGGAGGGFDTPVRGRLYPQLAEELPRDGIAGLRIRYRHPNDLEECVLDVLAGTVFLKAEHIDAIALVGHSFGGAVVIQAAALCPDVRTCVALSTQTYGADPAAELGPRCSLLLAHGLDDEILPADCSRFVYRSAREPKQLLLKKGARHGLDEWADELPAVLREWIRTALAEQAPAQQ